MNGNDYYSNNSFNNQQNDFGQHYSDEEYFRIKAQADSLSSKCMVLGILAIAFAFFCPCVPSFIFAIISLVLCSKVKKLTNCEKMNGYQLTGMICSIISLVISAIYLALIVWYIFVIGIATFWAMLFMI